MDFDIFCRDVTDKVGNQKTLYYASSNNLCFCSGHIVLDKDQAPPKEAHQPSPQFSADVYYGQTAGWIKLPLGTEVGLGPGHIVLDEDQAPPKEAQRPFSLRWSTVVKRSSISAAAGHLLVMFFCIFLYFSTSVSCMYFVVILCISFF